MELLTEWQLIGDNTETQTALACAVLGFITIFGLLYLIIKGNHPNTK